MNTLWNVANLRLKLIYRNLTIRILTIVIVILFSAIVGNLFSEIENSTKLEIGIVDESKSDFSKELINNLKKNELLKVTQITLAQGKRMVNKEEITGLFVINEDVEERVYNGDLEGLIDLYYLSDNHLSPMIGDIFIGEMLEEISIITAVNYLEEALGEERTNTAILQGAYQYGQELAKNPKENYYVAIEFISLQDSALISADKINNQIIYKQMILGIILSFLSFFTLFSATSIVKDEETTLVKKLIISKTSRWEIITGEYFSVVISSSVIALILSSVLAYYSHNFIMNFLVISFIFLLFIASFSAFILLLAKVFLKVSSYIVLGSVTILILGIMSGCFFNIDLAMPFVKNISYILPQYQAITRLMNVVVNENIIGITAYIIYAIIFTTLLLMVSILFWRIRIKEN